MKPIFLLIFSFFSLTSFSEPFCVVSSYGKNCSYSNYDFCVSQAKILNGACTANNNFQQQNISGYNAPFCVVSSYGTDCSYTDANVCKSMAKAVLGACATNPNN